MGIYELSVSIGYLVTSIGVAAVTLAAGRRVDRALRALDAPRRLRMVNAAVRIALLAGLAIVQFISPPGRIVMYVVVVAVAWVAQGAGPFFELVGPGSGSPQFRNGAVRWRWVELQRRVRRLADKRPDEAILLLDRAMRLVAELQPEATDTSWNAAVAIALTNKASLLLRLGRNEAALRAYREATARLDDATEETVREEFADALVGAGHALVQLDRPSEALETFDEVQTRFGNDQSPATRVSVARAEFNAGVTLRTLDRGDEAIVRYRSAIEWLGDMNDHDALDLAGMTLTNLSLANRDLGRLEPALEAAEEVGRRLGQSTDPGLHHYLAEALIDKARVYVLQGDISRALAAYDAVGSQARRVPSSLRDLVLLALVEKAELLAQDGRCLDSIAACEKAERAIASAHDADTDLLERVHRARAGCGDRATRTGETG